MHRRSWPPFAAALALAPALLFTGGPPATAATVAAGHTRLAGTTYYVDSAAGNDASAGTSATTAWRTLRKVNGFAFQPGDTVQFKRGGSWNGTLTLSRSGTAASPITLTAYGSGNLPVVGGRVTNCVSVAGSHWTLTNLRASGCDWAGFELYGDGILLESVQADANVVGVSIVEESDGNTIRQSRIVDNNKMSVNTPPTRPEWRDDDSGAFGFLIHGNDNVISHNTVTGHFANSYDYGYDGSAFEIYNGNRNRIEYNVTADNETFTELARNGDGMTADGNVFAYNSVTSTKPRGSFLVTRGGWSDIGPVTGTKALNNSVYLPSDDSEGWVCFDGCGPDILTLRGNVIEVGGKVGYEDGWETDDDSLRADDARGVYYGSVYQFEPGPDSVADVDPLFTSTTDLRLRAGSPAIGRGEDLGYPYDLAGTPLAGATRFDAGAYQYLP